MVVEFLDFKLHIDDPVGAVGVHCANGIWGTIAEGLLNTESGLFYGGGFKLLGIQEPDAEHHQEAGHDANQDSPKGIRHVTGRGDRHQPGQGSVQAHGHIRFTVFQPGKNHAHYGGHCRRHCGGQEDGAQLLHAGSRRAVEAVPAQPQDEHAQGSQRDAVAGESVHFSHLAVLVRDELADAGP